MASCPSACKTLYVSPSFRDHTCDDTGMVLSHVTQDHGQILGPELGLMEMSEVEYTQFQHLIQAHMEAHIASPDVPDARSHPDTLTAKDATVISPFAATQAIDLSTSTGEHCLVMPGETTPASYGEVPAFVLARVRGADSPTERSANTSTLSHKRSRSAARVCLEKRFNTLSADTPRHEDVKSAVLSNFWAMLQQSAEAQWMKTDRANSFEVSSPFVGGAFSPVTNTYEQVIGHIPYMAEPNKHPGLIIPKTFPLKVRLERVVIKAHSTSKSTEEQQLVNTESDVGTPAAFRKHGSTHSSQPIKPASFAPDAAGESRSSTRKTAGTRMSLIQRRERHNSKERERRKRIRLYCNELNTLVPFCKSDTDKATTLRWTTAFLKYLKKMYGDSFKEEFQKTFTDEKGHFLKASSSSGQDPIHWEMLDTLGISLAVEQ